MNVQVYLRLDPLLVAQSGFAMPVLQHLLAKGSVTKNTEVYEAVICQAFGVEKQLDWPAAALSWLGEGNSPGDYFWLYADPVNLQLQRDHFTLNLPAPVPMTEAESQALCVFLNRHFEEDGLEFHVGNSGQWYLRQAAPSAIAASFPSQAAGRDIRDFLPTGMAAEKWRSVLNEIQMLLHEHPVNMAREEQGQISINSLWISGPGLKPLPAQVPPKTVFADHPLARGLAEWAGKAALPPPDYLAFSSDDEDVLLVLEDKQDDMAQWLDLLQARLQTRRVRRLTINVFAGDQHLHVTLKPGDLWKLWRKQQPLASYFSW